MKVSRSVFASFFAVCLIIESLLMSCKYTCIYEVVSMAKKPGKKSGIINIRITPEQRWLIDKYGLSPTEIFNKMVNKEVIEKKKEIARENLQKYPQIKSLFQEKWVLEQINALKFNTEMDVNGHGLAWLLSNFLDEKVLKRLEENKKKAKEGNVDAGMMAYLQGSHSYEPLLKLEDLEKNLEILKDEKRIIRTIKKAKNDDQFWKTLSEIEVAAHFKTKGILKELEPAIGGKTPDLSIVLDKQEFYVEIFTPDMAQELEESIRTGEAVALGNRAWEKLDDKMNQLPKGMPAIIVINRSFSEIDSINVADAIMGSLSLLLSKDPKIEPKTIRQQDGLAHTMDLSNIKAIIIYKRVFDFNHGLVTIPEVKRMLVKDGKDMTKKQEAILTEVFRTMIFNQIGEKGTKE